MIHKDSRNMLLGIIVFFVMIGLLLTADVSAPIWFSVVTNYTKKLNIKKVRNNRLRPVNCQLSISYE